MSGASLLANGITNAASAYTQVAGAYSGAKYMVRSQQAMDRMQENQADKMDRDVEFQRINGIAESNAQAASAAAQVSGSRRDPPVRRISPAPMRSCPITTLRV